MMTAKQTGRTGLDARLRQRAYDAMLARADELPEEEWREFESINDRAILQIEICDLWEAVGNDERAGRGHSSVKSTVERMREMSGIG